MAHLNPLPRDTHPDLVDSFNHYQATRGFVPNSILTMQRRPNIVSIYQASVDKIAAVWEYQTSPLFSDAERAALNLAFKASIVPNEASEIDFTELKRHFNDDQIVEIVASIALFSYLNRWNDTMATDLEKYPAGVAGKLIGGVGWDVGKHKGN